MSVGGGRAGCRREGTIRVWRGCSTSGAAGQPSLPSGLGTPQGGHPEGPTHRPCGQTVFPEWPPGSFRHPGGGPQRGAWHRGPGPSPAAPRAAWASRTLRTAGAPAASRAEAGAAHRVTGGPGGTVTDTATVQAEEARRAGCRERVVMGHGQGGRVHPPAPARPSSPRSQKAPLQPAGQVHAPLTWSQAAPCSHWHCRPQPGPKWPWGHPETRSPGPLSAGAGEIDRDPPAPLASQAERGVGGTVGHSPLPCPAKD